MTDRLLEVRRPGVDGHLHRFRADGAFSLCGRIPISHAGPPARGAGPLCPHCWPPLTDAAELTFVGEPIDLPPPFAHAI